MVIREATPADAPGIAKVHVDSWRTTYRGILPDDFLAGLSYEARERYWAGAIGNPDYRGFLYVAEDGPGNIVGFAAGGPPQTEETTYEGELYVIYVLEGYQGRGIGRKLVSAVVSRLNETGIHSMLVWVISSNPFRRFYEVLGGEKVYEKEFQLGGVMLTEWGYGWMDTRSMI
ncbi:MAG: GNAT family N-acetyltransferase [Chloroflexota bacterium]|nr:GNAT family N-acetyltransferase [Chloroflexota bacterium]